MALFLHELIQVNLQRTTVFTDAQDLLLSKKLKHSESAAFRGIGHTSKESATHQTFDITYT